MAVDDFFHNGQAYTQTAALTLTAFLGTPKTLEHHAALLGGKADARIANGNRGHDIAALYRNGNLARRRRIADRVRDEVRGRLAQHVAITVNNNVGLCVILERKTGVVDERLMRHNERANKVAHVDDLLIHGSRTALEARELQNGVDQAGKALHLGVDRVQALFIGLEHAIHNGLDRRLNRHEGRAQFMRHVSGKATLKFLVALNAFGHGVKRFGKLGDFVFAIEVHASRKVAFLDFLRRFRDAINRAHQATGEQDADKRRKRDR